MSDKHMGEDSQFVHFSAPFHLHGQIPVLEVLWKARSALITIILIVDRGDARNQEDYLGKYMSQRQYCTFADT